MVPQHRSTASVAEVGKMTLSLCDYCRLPHLVVQCTVVQSVPLLLFQFSEFPST